MSMVILFSAAIYSHYFAWWVYFNYLNDVFYDQFWRQLLLSTTEVVSTVVVILLVNKKNPVTTQKISTIVT